MPQANDMVRKLKIQIAGNEQVDLIKFGELNFEDIPVEVPSYKKIVTILAGINKVNPIPCTFKIQRNTTTLKDLNSWRTNREIKDVTVIETDGTGTEYHRWILIQCEAGNMKLPEYDAASPTYAQAEITLYPFDIIEI
jgi:hypothetical protein